MKHNVGAFDRTLRLIVGIALIAVVFVGPKSNLGWVGIIFLFTGLFGTCPLYSVLGISTCKRKGSAVEPD